MTKFERTSAFRRLDELPSPAEMLRSGDTGETSYVRYLPTMDPAEQAYAGEDGVLMTQEELDAMEAQIEAREYERLRRESGDLSENLPSTDADIGQRHLNIELSGPDGKIKIRVDEGVNGDKIARMLGAVSGISLSPAPAQQVYYPQTPAPEFNFPSEQRMLTAEAEVPMYGTHYATEEYYDEQNEAPAVISPIDTIGSMLDESQRPRSAREATASASADAKETNNTKRNAIRAVRVIASVAVLAVIIVPSWKTSKVVGGDIERKESIDPVSVLSTFVGNLTNEEKE